MMVKDSVQDRDSTIKKRRKGGSSNTSATSAKVPEGDVYKVCEIWMTSDIRYLYEA